MDTIVVGCGRAGAELASQLYKKGHTVVVVDRSAVSFQNLSIDFRGRTVEGDAMNEDVLRRAGIEQSKRLAAVTSSDAINAVVAHLARVIFKVPFIVVRNFDTRWQSMHNAFGHQAVSSSSWGARRMAELLYQGETRSVYSVGGGEVELCEFVIPEEWQGRSLAALLDASECLPVSLSRAGRALLPDGEEALETGDLILVSATQAGRDALGRNLKRSTDTEASREK